MEPLSVPPLPLPRVFRPERAVPSDAVRPTRAEINLAHLRHNLRVLRRAAGSAEVWAVLKADGYGHGAKAVARTLERAGAAGLCVALLEEAIELREAGIRAPILVMGGYFGRAWDAVIAHQLTPVIHDITQIEALAEAVRFQGMQGCHAHLKVDTGMARLGFPLGELSRAAQKLRSHPEVVVTGLMTHLACADSGDPESVTDQLARFTEASEVLRRGGIRPRVFHAANSAALLTAPASHLDMVRPGVGIFGVSPCAGVGADLRPVMRVRSEVIAVRDIEKGASVGYGASWRAKRPSRIATVPMGYADGLGRALSNRGNLLIRGKRAPVVGVVSMDMTMVDVTELPGAQIGDECVILGTQKGVLGTGAIGAVELAESLGTIPWEVLTSVSRRVPRFYREPC